MRQKIITSFFTDLEKIYQYSILHHADKVFSEEDDIDFIVNCDRSKMLSFVKEFSNRNNLLLGNHYTIDKSIYRFDIFCFVNNVFKKIELDCACNSNSGDLLKIQCQNLLINKMTVQVDGMSFFKISNADEIEYYIKKKAFKNSDISSYTNYFKSLDKVITEEFIISRYQYWQDYFRSISYKTKYIKNKASLLIKRIFEKPALSISFLGSDGSGKSTIIEAVKKYPLFINYYYYHLKPLKHGNTLNAGEIVIDPHKFPPYSKFKSYIKLCYLIGQYSLGWLINITPLTIKSSLVIFDRYFDDLLVDNRRYRYGGDIKFAKFARIFIPRPDMYFILTADATVIYERKQEVAFTELERQIEEYRRLADDKRYFNIDVNRTPEEITKEIVNIMMEKMNER